MPPVGVPGSPGRVAGGGGSNTGGGNTGGVTSAQATQIARNEIANGVEAFARPGGGTIPRERLAAGGADGEAVVADGAGLGYAPFPDDPPASTDELPEGGTNRYFTDARADARADARVEAGVVVWARGRGGAVPVANLPIATQAEAEAGESGLVLMTPARVAEAIAALAQSGGGTDPNPDPGPDPGDTEITVRYGISASAALPAQPSEVTGTTAFPIMMGALATGQYYVIEYPAGLTVTGIINLDHRNLNEIGGWTHDAANGLYTFGPAVRDGSSRLNVRLEGTRP